MFSEILDPTTLKARGLIIFDAPLPKSRVKVPVNDTDVKMVNAAALYAGSQCAPGLAGAHQLQAKPAPAVAASSAMGAFAGRRRRSAARGAPTVQHVTSGVPGGATDARRIEGHHAVDAEHSMLMAKETTTAGTVAGAAVIDSGAVAHITRSSANTSSFAPTKRVIVWGDGSRTPAEGIGTVKHRLHQAIRGESAPQIVALDEVLHVPGATTDLISLTVLLKRGWRADFGRQSMLLVK